ncbi:MAG: FAD-binding protein [Sphingobacteriales bacterium]|nr:MAG: FAD-binding protein [Sphingobacteriales bacterium]
MSSCPQAEGCPASCGVCLTDTILDMVWPKRKPVKQFLYIVEQNNTDLKLYDVIIIGGGPAGMSAALILARSRRNILIFDTGKQRNRMSDAMHGYLTRDGVSPAEFLKIARHELTCYDVEVQEVEIDFAEKTEDYFLVTDRNDQKYKCRKLLLATGLTDNIPDIEGIHDFYGKSVHHCPYCDGWEKRDKRIVVYGRGNAGHALSITMLNWTNNVILCTDGGKKPRQSQLAELKKRNVEIYTGKIDRLEGENGQLQKVHLCNGYTIDCNGMFFTNGYAQHSVLGRSLNCHYNMKNEIRVNHVQESSVEGLYVSGDAAHEMKLVIIAAGEGAKAAVAINVKLIEEDNARLLNS